MYQYQKKKKFSRKVIEAILHQAAFIEESKQSLMKKKKPKKGKK